MRIIEAESGPKIYVGHMLENEVTKVQFDPYPFYDAAGPGGTFSVYILRYGETEGYVVSSPLVTVEDGYVYWTVTAADVAIAGDNECQLRYTVSDKVAMSKKYKYVVSESISVGDTVPAPMQEWADEIVAAAAEIVPMPEDVARVSTVSSLDTVLGVKNDEVKQTSVDNVRPSWLPKPFSIVSPPTYGYVSANNTLNFSMVGDRNGGVKAVMIIIGANANNMEIILLNTSTSAELTQYAITGGANPLTITPGTKVDYTLPCSMQNNSVASYVYFLVFRGSITID